MSQDFSDDSGKIWTPDNALQITTTDQFKFGAQSFLPNSPGGITTPAHVDFATGTGNFTWEFWVRWSVSNTEYFFVRQDAPGGGVFEVYVGRNGEIECTGWDDSVNNYFSIYIDPWSPFSINTWYAIAVQRVGDDGNIFIDGVAQGTSNYFDAGASVPNHGAPMLLGRDCSTIYVDELRFSNTNRYPAGGYTPAVAPFTLDANTKVLLHFEPKVVAGLGQVILWKRKGV